MPELDLRIEPQTPPVLPVSALNRLVRERLESGFPLCWVSGEVSNLTYAASGHVYFSLKDAAAQVRCVMFRNRVQLLGWRLENGQRLEVRVLVTLYEARGDFQLNVEIARRAGAGNLYEQFLRLKEKLEREGLFAAAVKRPLPAFPRRVGIVTSPQAAALRDVLSTLARRAPQVSLLLYPTLVQGDGAATQIVAALEQAARRHECDVLIVCRGGGSIEDLWAFNDEALARAIRACPMPVISGVGHETDFTIADFAADQRAPTPTAAAEMVAPERDQLLLRIGELQRKMQRQFERGIELRSQQLDWLARRLLHPAQQIAQQRLALTHLQHRLDSALERSGAHGQRALAGLARRLLLARPDTARQARRLDTLASQLPAHWRQGMERKAAELTRIEASLAHLNPQAVLGRGYSIVSDSAGRIIRDSHDVEPNDKITVNFARGRVSARVDRVSHTDNNDIVTVEHPDQ